MHREKYWASKVPLFLVLLFLLNIFLIVAAELLFIYKYPAQPDSASLAKHDAVYRDCRVILSDSKNYLTASTVETANGQPHLVVTKAHGIAFGRGKILYAEPVEMPESGQLTVYVKNGIHTSEIRLTEVPGGTLAVTIEYGYSGGIRETVYMVLAALLEALELMVVHFIKNRLQ